MHSPNNINSSMLLYLLLVISSLHLISNVACDDEKYLDILKCYFNITGSVSREVIWPFTNEAGSDGLLPIHRSSYQGKVEVVKALIWLGVPLDVLDNKLLKPPMIWAARGGSVDVLGVLKEKVPGQIKWSDKDGTALNWAAKERQPNAVKWLIAQNISLESRDGFHMSPLQTASYNGDLESAKLLLDHGADIESYDNYYWTPLFWSTANGHIEVVKLLLNRSAIVNRNDKISMTPLHEAAMGHSVNHTGDMTAVLQMLLDHGAKLEARSNNGFYAIHWSVGNNRLHNTEFLLKRGLSVNSKSFNGMTPLHLASSKGYLLMAELLVGWGALINDRDNSNRTALNFAYDKYMTNFIISKGGSY